MKIQEKLMEHKVNSIVEIDGVLYRVDNNNAMLKQRCGCCCFNYTETCKTIRCHGRKDALCVSYSRLQ